jgi:Trypsin-co-occurring domain 1
MVQVVRYPLDEGGFALIDIREDSVGTTRVSVKERGVVEAATALTAALEPLRKSIRTVLSAVTDVAEGVSEVEVCFGIRLHAELGAIVALGGETNFEVRVHWTPPSRQGE